MSADDGRSDLQATWGQIRAKSQMIRESALDAQKKNTSADEAARVKQLAQDIAQKADEILIKECAHSSVSASASLSPLVSMTNTSLPSSQLLPSSIPSAHTHAQTYLPPLLLQTHAEAIPLTSTLSHSLMNSSPLPPTKMIGMNNRPSPLCSYSQYNNPQSPQITPPLPTELLTAALSSSTIPTQGSLSLSQPQPHSHPHSHSPHTAPHVHVSRPRVTSTTPTHHNSTNSAVPVAVPTSNVVSASTQASTTTSTTTTAATPQLSQNLTREQLNTGVIRVVPLPSSPTSNATSGEQERENEKEKEKDTAPNKGSEES
ncbi:hypothetical protein Pelo_14714 [Pelomyxa schiedti]|nr:hypothetical protein Pelo_14714 [Pelomyxa schiedti]